MKPSPNPKKLKKAAKKLRANKNAREEAKAAQAEKAAVVQTPSPKPILKTKEEPKGMGCSSLQLAICKYIYEN